MSVRQLAFQLFLRVFAADLVDAAYLGLLGREPGIGGFSKFSRKLRGSSDLVNVLKELCGSDEHWQRLIDAKSLDLVRVTYRGLLDREPEPEALKSYAGTLAKTRSLSLLLREISRSDEHWRKTINARAPELVRALYTGLLNREPEPEALEAGAAKLAATHNVSPLIAEIASSNEYWHRTLEARSTELVRALYRGLLHREPEPEALSAYSAKLNESHDLASLLTKIGRSTEQWHRILEARSTELVRALFQGLLRREPEPEALESYANRLSQSHDLAPLLAEIVSCNESWQRMLEARAPDIVRAMYRGLLRREPEPEVLQASAAKLSETHDMASALAGLSRSDEMWKQQLAVRAPQLVESMYQSLLEREADSLGLSTYSSTITELNGVGKVLSTIVGSVEFIKQQQRLGVVFLHIQKTAGTSIQTMMRDFLGKEFYGEHADSLNTHTPRKLSAFSAFSGHFNHDSLSFIPCRRLVVFTFVREPKERLVSHYYFWRAHEPTAPAWGGGQKIANELLIEEFFERKAVRQSSALWNHMTWVIMGQRQWESWRLKLTGAANENPAEFISTTARPAIRQRLREFAFVGLQKDFERSVEILCETLKWPRFKTVRAEHSLKRLTQTNPHFKKQVDRQPVTERLTSLLDDCVQLDNVVYEEAQLLYAERLQQLRQTAILGPKKLYDSEVTSFSASDVNEFKLVFLHLPRTGGTALHSLLAQQFDENAVWPERFNALCHHAVGELARYRYYSGHFDLPSIKVIPGQKRIITMLREPSDRLVSLYYHQRAHQPEGIERQGFELAGLANCNSIAEFFRQEEVRSHVWINNAMCRALTQTMDGKWWGDNKEGDAPTKRSPPNVALALRELKALDGFGLMERFEDSVHLIFSAISLPIPAVAANRRASNIVADRDPGIRKIEREPISDEIREVIDDLIVADLQIYEQAKSIFEKRLQSMDRSKSKGRGRSAN